MPVDKKFWQSEIPVTNSGEGHEQLENIIELLYHTGKTWAILFFVQHFGEVGNDR